MLVSHTIWGKSVTLLDNSIVIVVSPGRFFFFYSFCLANDTTDIEFSRSTLFLQKKGNSSWFSQSYGRFRYTEHLLKSNMVVELNTYISVTEFIWHYAAITKWRAKNWRHYNTTIYSDFAQIRENYDSQGNSPHAFHCAWKLMQTWPLIFPLTAALVSIQSSTWMQLCCGINHTIMG